jgi:hypothetical protein
MVSFKGMNFIYIFITLSQRTSLENTVSKNSILYLITR